jgi:hypothetical protein
MSGRVRYCLMGSGEYAEISGVETEKTALMHLKGPKREIFVTGIFTEIRPVWVGDLETRPIYLKSLCLGPYITIYFLGFLF